MNHISLRHIHAPRRARLFLILLLVAFMLPASLLQSERAAADSTYHTLCSAGTLTAFTQNWSNTGLITANDNWSGVPSIIGYLSAGSVARGTDPQTVLVDGTSGALDVNANRSDPSDFSMGGIAEFDGIANPVVAFQGSGGANAPFLLIQLNAAGASGIRLQYTLRDIDSRSGNSSGTPPTDNTTQQVALHYRVGTSGNFTNLPGGYVADADQTGATATYSIDVTLPAAADNQSQVQVRVMTVDAASSDAFIGVDDISITATCGGSADGAPSVSSTTPGNGATGVAMNADISISFSENVNVGASAVSVVCPTGGPITFTGLPAINVGSVTLNPDADLPQGSACTVTVLASGVTDADSNDPPDNMAANYTFSFTTGSVTTIGAIQGTGAASPLVGTNQIIRGVVTGYYDNPSAANDGLFVQNVGTIDVSNGGNDGNPASSDGIFVYVNPLPAGVATGDSVQVSGVVGESFGQTHIGSTSAPASVVEAGAFGTVAATPLSLPLASATALETYEGMLVSFSQPLYVTEHYQLFQYGQFVVSSGDRLYQPTGLYPPSTDPASPVKVAEANNLLNQIMIDDRSDEGNPVPVVFPTGNLSATNTLRIGDTVTSLEGPLHYAFSRYRVQPNTINFTSSNPRPTAAPVVPGEVHVAAANLLNYFNGNGAGGGFPTPRGATNAAEFVRQRDKTINMLCAINADVVGLIELENDVDSSADSVTSAVEDLVAGLNAAPNCGPYTYIETGTIGGDEIRVGLIYRDTVQPVGAFAILDSVAPFNVNTRPPLAQTFSYNGELFTVVVNHFKSKGCTGTPAPTGANVDLGDGQGCWNADRVAAADALLGWLATDPTASGDPDVLIVGDLNAYAQEDPITHLRDGGYTNLIASLLGNSAYSYVFSAQSGYLDHALASASLTPLVAGVAEWHVNADEPAALDYNTEYGKPASFYESGPFRISDHDPVIVGLSLTAPVVVSTSTPVAGGAPNLSIQDPALSKIGELAPGAVGLPGERLTWTITITNTGTATATNVIATDVLRNELYPEQATTTLGSVSISGQTVIITIPTLNAGQSAVVQLMTTVVSSPTDNVFVNEVSVSGNGLNARMARGVVTSLAGTRLPSTGYGQPDPTPSLVLLAGVLLVLVAASGLLLRRRA